MEGLRLCQILSYFLVIFFINFQALCSSISSSSSPALCLPNERSALLQFKNSFTVSSGYASMISWTERSDCCSWQEVRCDNETGHVIGLSLSYAGLVGPLYPNNSLFLLEGLLHLDLSANNFSGSQFSLDFSVLSSLKHLDLSLTGLSIPEISLPSTLIFLDLSGNEQLIFVDYSFQMLLHNLTEPEQLLLDGVNLSSVVPSNSMRNLSHSFTHLSLSHCGLQGELPSEVFSLPHLQELKLKSNPNLTGHLPNSDWGNSLKILELSEVSFSQDLPTLIGNLKLLEVLELRACNFTGLLPSSLGNLTQLSVLDLSSNVFRGHIPNVSGLSNLNKLDLSDNFLGGRIPGWLFTMPSLNMLILDHNKLTGPIENLQNPSSLGNISMSDNGIHGSIPSSFFDNLPFIDSIDLSSNYLNGQITSCMLSKLKSLRYLDLSNNSMLSLSYDRDDVNCSSSVDFSSHLLMELKFSSCNIRQFPRFLRWTNLEYIDLSNNKIEGSIFSRWESEGWDNLSFFDLSDNFISGIEQFPTPDYLEFIDLSSNLLQGTLPEPPPSLVFFAISSNQLTGIIPSPLCNLTYLEVLDLSTNNLSGTIPECLGISCKKLSSLKLNDNQLQGFLPRSLANCSQLAVLDVGNNKLKDIFPHWLGGLQELQVLILRANRFYGPIHDPPSKHSFLALRILDLSQNEFNGLFPSKFMEILQAMKDENHVVSLEDIYFKHTPNFKRHSRVQLSIFYDYYASVNLTMKGVENKLMRISTAFTIINLSSNQFHGNIAERLGELESLRLLNLSHNQLTGHIPASLGKLALLEALDLSSNMLSGRVPAELTNLGFLAVFNISYNSLVGNIPRGKQFDTFTNYSYVGNLGLCGLPLSEKCEEVGEPSPPEVSSEKGDSASLFDWKFATMGYGCGLICGMSMGYIVFTLGKPRWLVKRIEEYHYRKGWKQGQRRREKRMT